MFVCFWYLLKFVPFMLVPALKEKGKYMGRMGESEKACESLVGRKEKKEL